MWNSHTDIPVYTSEQLPAGVRVDNLIPLPSGTGCLYPPTPREQALMTMAGIWAEHFPFLPADPCAWPAVLQDQVWCDLTPAVCLTGFEAPLRPQEALRQCQAEVMAWYSEDEDIVRYLCCNFAD